MAADGLATPVRWAVVPDKEAALETTAQAARTDRNFLFDDLATQLRQGPLRWHLVATLGLTDDPVADATLPWPSNRKSVELGTLTLTDAVPEAAGNCRSVNFDPPVLPDGIAPSDDPLLSARSAAYARSFTRRAGEKKSPSAVAATPARGADL